MAAGLGAAAEPAFDFNLREARARAAEQPSPSGRPVAFAPRAQPAWSLSGAFSRGGGGANGSGASFSAQWRLPWLFPRLSDYQIGDEWGKKPVTAQSLAAGGAVFERAAKATAHYGGATA